MHKKPRKYPEADCWPGRITADEITEYAQNNVNVWKRERLRLTQTSWKHSALILFLSQTAGLFQDPNNFSMMLLYPWYPKVKLS